jgi:hypothetical protein
MAVKMSSPQIIFKMKPIIKGLLLLALPLIASCNQTDTDTEYPVIDMSGSDAFPKNCQTVQRGQTFVFKATFSDNMALGSFSIDIHHNFNHHSHSTESETCTMGDVKTAVNPFVYIKSFDIDQATGNYVAEIPIEVPLDVDEGDYHFRVSLTDHEGWRTMKGISIKIE